MILKKNKLNIDLFGNDEELEVRKKMLEIIRKDGRALYYADIKFKKDPEIVLEAIKQNAWFLIYADPVLKKNKQFIAEAIKLNSQVLEHINKEM